MRSPLKIFKGYSRAVRRKIYLKYIIAGVLLMTVFMSGYVTVYVNTYNIMHEDKMVVFSVDRSEDGVSITVMGKVIGTGH
ncbi:MAG: hypothetical protein J1F11_01725 [Oscillospiraceae bacterium]|nr:hypothetical protein [Oscillospiraceae bacterium]